MRLMMKKIIIGVCCLLLVLGVTACGSKQEYRILENASLGTSAMQFFYFDGENTYSKCLFDQDQVKEIVEEINHIEMKAVDFASVSKKCVPCYGMVIADKGGWGIWISYFDGIWLLNDGTAYKAKYDVASLYESIQDAEPISWESGNAMPNAFLLGQKDLRFYEKVEDLPSEKDGIVLSIVSVEQPLVTIQIQNNTKHSFNYGARYSLQKEVDGQWYSLPHKYPDYAFHEIGLSLPGGEQTEEICNLSMYGELGKGHYKLEKEDLAAEFFVD